MPNLTKDTMTLADVPKHATVEEFLADPDLVGLYEREFAKLKESDPDYAAAKARLAKAKLAAVTTEAASAAAEAEAQEALANEAAMRADEQRLFDKLVRGGTLTDAEKERAKAIQAARKESP